MRIFAHPNRWKDIGSVDYFLRMFLYIPLAALAFCNATGQAAGRQQTTWSEDARHTENLRESYVAFSSSDGIVFQRLKSTETHVLRLYSRSGQPIEYPTYCMSSQCIYYWSQQDHSLAIEDESGRQRRVNLSQLVDRREEAYAVDMYACGPYVYVNLNNEQDNAYCIRYSIRSHTAYILRKIRRVESSLFSNRPFICRQNGTIRISAQGSYLPPSNVYKLLGSRDFVSWQFDPSENLFYMFNDSNIVEAWKKTNMVCKVLIGAGGYVRGLTPISAGQALVGASSPDEQCTYLYSLNAVSPTHPTPLCSAAGVAASPYYILSSSDVIQWARESRK